MNASHRAVPAVFRAALLAGALIPAAASVAAGGLGPGELRTRHASLQLQLASNALGSPIVVQSEETGGRVDGHVYAILDHPFPAVAATLSEPAQWCEILILHPNTKWCRAGEEGSVTQVRLRVGKNVPQELAAASPMIFSWQGPELRMDYLDVEMDAASGPYDTRDYKLSAEAVPLGNGRTFLHLGYALSYGGAGQVAINLYLATLGRGKVGFTREPTEGAAEAGYVQGMRSMVERNAMRYYLAIDSYLRWRSAPQAQQMEQRLKTWFDATQRYPRQLRDIDRDAYLQMKRAEVQRQSSLR